MGIPIPEQNQQLEVNMACEHCGSAITHAGRCPSVKAIEYYPDGTVRRVEYVTAADSPPYMAPPTIPPWPKYGYTSMPARSIADMISHNGDV